MTIPTSITREFGRKLSQLKELCHIDGEILNFKIVNKKNGKVFLEQCILNNTLVNLIICDRELRFRYANLDKITSYLYLTHYNKKYLEIDLERRDLIIKKQNNLLDKAISTHKAFIIKVEKTLNDEIMNNTIEEEIVKKPVIKQEKKITWTSLIFKRIQSKKSMAGDWRKAEFWGHDFRGENFSQSDMSFGSFYCCDFSQCHLQKIKAVKTDFSFVNFANSNLTEANLTGANLTGANLTKADLTGANLTGANLTKANLTGANLTEANLTGANLTETNPNKHIRETDCNYQIFQQS